MNLNDKKLIILIVGLLVGVQNVYAETITTTYFHTDRSGSIIAASSEGGEVLWRKTFDSYGNEITVSQNGEELEEQTYSGKPYDPETGLLYFNQRYYDPDVRMFMGLDSIGFRANNPTSFNRYAYANNNPYKFIDPDGRDAVIIGEPGEVGGLFRLAAETWIRDNPGDHQVFEVSTGKEFINAIETYAESRGGKVDGLQYFGHSNNTGLLVSQSDGLNSIYTSWYRLENFYNCGVDSANLTGIDDSLFSDVGNVTLHGCNAGVGQNSAAQALANEINSSVSAAIGPTVFSGVKGGLPKEGLPSIVLDTYEGNIYLVPQYQDQGFKEFEPETKLKSSKE